MRKLSFAVTAVLVLLAGYVVAGPYLAIRAIGEAVRDNDARALSRQVDFPALRESLKIQLGDRLVRKVGIESQSSLLGAIGVRMAGGLIDAGVEATVTPLGLAALFEGRQVWRQASAPPVSTRDAGRDRDVARGEAAVDGDGSRHDPLRDAEHRFESASRFTATIVDEDGDPLVFVLTRRGITWRLSDIRLPE